MEMACWALGVWKWLLAIRVEINPATSSSEEQTALLAGMQLKMETAPPTLPSSCAASAHFRFVSNRGEVPSAWSEVSHASSQISATYQHLNTVIPLLISGMHGSSIVGHEAPCYY